MNPASTARLRDGVALVALASVVQWPIVRRAISPLDEGTLLSIGEGLSRGDVLYADRHSVFGPVTFEFLSLLYRCFGASVTVGRVAMAVLFLAVVWLTYDLGARASGRRAGLVAAVAVVAVKPLGFPMWTIVNYSQIVLLFCMASTALVYRYWRSPSSSKLALAGACIGLAVATKQNIGGLWAVATAAILLARAYRHASWLDGLREVVWVAGGATAVVGFFVARYAYLGAVAEMFEQTVVTASTSGDAWSQLLPPPVGWTTPGPAFESLMLAYVPAAVGQLWLGGTFENAAPNYGATIATAVLVTYYAPPVLGCTVALRSLRARVARVASGWTWEGGAALLFGAVAYASMLYRADWAHLANVAPVVIVATVVAATRGGKLAGAIGAVAGFVWFAGALFAWLAIPRIYNTPLDTDRGRLYATPVQVAHVRAILDAIAETGDGARVLLLRGQSLFYFLSARPPLVHNELVLPGVFRDRDDLAWVEDLDRADAVIYDAHRSRLIPGHLQDDAPRVADKLATEFRVSRRLTPVQVELVRDEPSPQGVPAGDPWQDFANAADGARTANWRAFRATVVPADDGPPQVQLHPLGPGGVRAEHWAFWNVLHLPATADHRRSCVEFPVPAAATAFSVTPLFRPDTWSPRFGGVNYAGRASFNMTLTNPGGFPTRVFDATLVAAQPPRRVHIDLRSKAASGARLGLCVTGHPYGRAPSDAPRLGANSLANKS